MYEDKEGIPKWHSHEMMYRNLINSFLPPPSSSLVRTTLPRKSLRKSGAKRTLSGHSSLSIFVSGARRFSARLVEDENETLHNLLELISCLSIGIVIAEIFEQNTQFPSPSLIVRRVSRNMFFQTDRGAKDAQGVCVNFVRNDAMHNVTVWLVSSAFARRASSAISIFSSFYLRAQTLQA